MSSPSPQMEPPAPLPRTFYARDTVTVAQELLNCLLVYQSTEGLCIGRISETEAYTADDPACHAYRGLTPRCAPLFEGPGHAYIYFTYGMHHCFNAVTEPEGRAGAVLIRAVEPLEGLALMRERRGVPEKISSDGAVVPGKARKIMPGAESRALCGGPARLCQAFGLTLHQNRWDLTGRSPLWIAPAPAKPAPGELRSTPRIGITRAVERLWRFTLRGDVYTSRAQDARIP